MRVNSTKENTRKKTTEEGRCLFLYRWDAEWSDRARAAGGAPKPETLAALQQLRETAGLSIFGIGIGANARLETIQAIATETFHLSSRPQDDQGELVPLLTQVA